MLMPFGGVPTWRRKVIEKSSRTAHQLAKTSVITHVLSTQEPSLNVTQRINLKIQTCSVSIGNHTNCNFSFSKISQVQINFKLNEKNGMITY